MKFINIAFFLIFCSCETSEFWQKMPEYRVIKTFSRRLKNAEGVDLYSYGVNHSLPRKDGHIKNHIADFAVSYKDYHPQDKVILLNSARCLLVSIAESFLKEINSDPTLKLDEFPFPNSRLQIILHFLDSNEIELGNGGISTIYFSKGKVKYERYEIYEYKKPIQIKGTPFMDQGRGKHFLVHEESYADALNIVQSEGCLKQY